MISTRSADLTGATPPVAPTGTPATSSAAPAAPDVAIPSAPSPSTGAYTIDSLAMLIIDMDRRQQRDTKRQDERYDDCEI